ncbi:MAG TPA: PD-(D/E)XK motif protein [Longimicrobiaceae bacterium]|nr:PD-(D/E)XK motif protein [Longimicrobiaceae bacterium]
MTRAGSAYAFDLLRTESPTAASIRVRDSDVTVQGGTVLHGLDTDGHLHLLVPLSGGEDGVTDQRSAGVQLRPTTLAAGGHQDRYLDVVCLLPHLAPLFCQVADEMLEEIRHGPERPAIACQMVLDRWRELLERRRTKLLGPEQLLGLFAELLVLDQLAVRHPGTALARWTGPLGHRLDFVSGSNAIEVKASEAREGRMVEIHGDRQLEPLPGGTLHLIYTRLEARDESGETIPELVDQIIGRGVPRIRFIEILEAFGFMLSDRDAYQQFRYVVLEHLTYLVNDQFPRIIPASFVAGSVPPGISRLRYTIDLSGPTPAPLSADEAISILDRFVSPS